MDYRKKKRQSASRKKKNVRPEREMHAEVTPRMKLELDLKGRPAIDGS